MTAAMTTPEAPDERITPELRKLTWILVLGSLAPALDTTIVNVALAALGRGLHTSVSVSQWTITGTGRCSCSRCTTSRSRARAPS
jgi:hypothetical protein